MALTREELIRRLSNTKHSFYNKDTPGVIVIHQNVPTKDAAKGMQWCEQVKAKFTNSKEWQEFKEKFPNWSFVLLPTNEYHSYVEIFCDNAEGRDEIESFVIERLDTKPQVIEDSEELRKKATDYVLLMMGAPVASPKISDAQIHMCYNLCVGYVRQAFKLRKYFDLLDAYQAQTEEFLFEGVLAHAMIAEGNAAGKPEMARDGEKCLAAWKTQLRPEEVGVGDADLSEER